MIKPYETYEDEPMMAAEPVAAYGSAVLEPEESTETVGCNEPEWEETIRLGLAVGLEQVKRGQTHSWENVYSSLKSRYGCA